MMTRPGQAKRRNRGEVTTIEAILCTALRQRFAPDEFHVRTWLEAMLACDRRAGKNGVVQPAAAPGFSGG
jgi:hypothetical protein